MKTPICLKLVKVVAHSPSEEDGDEILLKFNRNRIWPNNKRFDKINANQSLLTSTEIALPDFGIVDIELWEYDHWFSQSLLGVFRIFVDAKTNGGEVYHCDLIKKSREFAAYSLYWVVNFSEMKNSHQIRNAKQIEQPRVGR